MLPQSRKATLFEDCFNDFSKLCFYIFLGIPQGTHRGFLRKIPSEFDSEKNRGLQGFFLEVPLKNSSGNSSKNSCMYFTEEFPGIASRISLENFRCIPILTKICPSNVANNLFANLKSSEGSSRKYPEDSVKIFSEGILRRTLQYFLQGFLQRNL